MSRSIRSLVIAVILVVISLSCSMPLGLSPTQTSIPSETPDSTATIFGIDGAGNVFYVRIKVEGQEADNNGETDETTFPEMTRSLKLTSPYMTGDDITLLQEKLLELGYTAVGNADGIFGKNTDSAVRQFQTDWGLTVDGIVGPSTWNSLWN